MSDKEDDFDDGVSEFSNESSVPSFGSYGSADGGGSTSSTQQVINRALDAISIFSSQINLLISERWHNIAFALSLLQFFTFALESPSWGDLDTYFFSYWHYFRTFGLDAANYTTVFAFSCILGTFTVVSTLGGLNNWRTFAIAAELPKSAGVVLQACEASRFLVLPTITMGLSVWRCDSRTTTLIQYPQVPCYGQTNVALTVLCAIFVTVVTLQAGHTTCTTFTWQPSTGLLSTSEPRLFAFIYLCGLLLHLLFAFNDGSELWRLLTAEIHAAAMLGIIIWIMVCIPFHRRRVNYVAVSLSIISFVFGQGRAEPHLGGVYNFVTCIIFSAALSVGAVLLLRRRFSRISRQVDTFLDESATTTSYEELQIPSEFDIDVAVRFAFFDSSDSTQEKAMLIFAHALDAYPQSVRIRVTQCLFLLQETENLPLVQATLKKIRRYETTLVQRFMMCLIETRRQQSVFQLDHGLEDITECLTSISVSQEACKEAIRAFWSGVEKEVPLAHLMETVDVIDYTEGKTESAFHQLIARYPKSSRVLRAYAVFMEECANDLEAAQSILLAAEMLDDARSRRHDRRSARKRLARRIKKDSRSNSVAPAPESSDGEEVVRYGTIAMKKPAKEPSSQRAMVRFQSKAAIARPTEDHEMEDVSDVVSQPSDHSPSEHSGRLDSQRLFSSGVLRQRKLRHQVEQSKTSSTTRLKWSVRVSLFVTLASGIVLFSAPYSFITDFVHSNQLLDDVGSMMTLALQPVVYARTIWYTVLYTGTNNVAILQPILAPTIQLMATAVNAYSDVADSLISSRTSQEMTDVWFNMPVRRSDYFPAEPALNISAYAVVTNTSLWKLTRQIIASARILVNKSTAFWATDITSDPDMRFICDNNQFGLLPGLETLQAVYFNRTQANIVELRYILIGIIVGCTVLLAAMSALLFWPSVRKIQEERIDVLRLLSALPKSTVQAIVTSIGAKDDTPSEATAEVQYASGNGGHPQGPASMMQQDAGVAFSSMPIVRRLGLRMGIGTLLPYGFVIGLFAVAFSFFFNSAQLAVTGYTTGYVRNSAKLAFFGYLDYGSIDPYMYPGGAADHKLLVSRSAEHMSTYYDGVVYGNSSLGLPGVFQTDRNIDNLLFVQPYTLDTGTTYAGLDMLYQQAKRMFDQVLALPVAAPNEDGPIYNNLLSLISASYDEQGPLWIALQSLQDIVLAKCDSAVTDTRTWLIVLFVFLIPVALVSMLMTMPLVSALEKQSYRTTRMLLMIPVDVIDATATLRDYLCSTKVASSQERLRSAFEESVARHQSILNSSVDAIVVMSANCIVEVFNPAAETLFGFKAHEVLGQNVSILMPPVSAAMHDAVVQRYLATGVSHIIGRSRDLVARRKDGTEFPISLSLTTGTISGSVFFTAHMHDITAARKAEQAILYEKARSEKLLQSLLPEAIADRLKDYIASRAEERPLIAEAYREVTVLFADIVNFTNTAAGLKAPELIYMLNKLFSGWDEITTKYDVEKIKTIGDCYMCAVGVPRRSLDHADKMINFAIEMLAYLEEFNKTSLVKLNIRIGIHSGPVIAGVLGNKKMCFDIWGDAVNVASRMESTGVAGKIQISDATYQLLEKSEFIFEERGRVEVKGKGQMLTYMFKARRVFRSESGRLQQRAAITPPKAMRRPNSRSQSALSGGPGLRADPTIAESLLAHDSSMDAVAGYLSEQENRKDHVL
eukprot:TRINITY_DN4101_c1_g1_i1.p1 TRINITY_DN4101_c1_g1~~TRINITY_DN4101_c1_g1_i1.p1  ORF type:complete len:1696 (-),score=422.37 TRINITY_DN4101_c1_g1_i1:277-5364(-)